MLVEEDGNMRVSHRLFVELLLLGALVLLFALFSQFRPHRFVTSAERHAIISNYLAGISATNQEATSAIAK